MRPVIIGKHGLAGKPNFVRGLFDADGLAADLEAGKAG
jgi:hypothetical protein